LAVGVTTQQVRKTIKMDVNLKRIMANSMTHLDYCYALLKRTV